MTTFLETKRLIIKITAPEHFEMVCALQADPDVMKFIGQGVRERAEVKVWFDKAIELQKKYGFSFGCVFEKETGEFVGRAGLIHLGYDDTQPEIEVGYVMYKKFWGKGYATELAKALVQWGFENLTVNKIVAVIRPQNEASRRVAEKIGMYYVKQAHYYGGEVAYYEIDRSSVLILPRTDRHSHTAVL